MTSRDLLSAFLGNRRALLVSFALAAVLAAIFAAKAFLMMISFPGARPTEPALEPWMTIGHIARTHEVPRSDLEQALGLDPGEIRRRSLAQLARLRGVPRSDLEAEIARILADLREADAAPDG